MSIRDKRQKIFLALQLPTLWRYFLWQYARVFALSLFAFIFILFSTRLEDFARFVTLGATLPYALQFALYQIPYILQIALPISSLIAALFLFQKISSSNACTAIRAAGVSLGEIVAPLLIFSALLSLFTFEVILDLSARSHFAAKELEFRMKDQNPIAIIHNSKALESSGMSIDMKGSLGTGKATDFVLAMNRGEDNRLALLIAKEMRLQNNALQGKDMSFITTFSNDGKELFDTLIIENALENSIGLQDLAKAVNTKRLRQSNDEMNFSHLLAKIQDLSKQFEMQLSQDEGVGHIRRLLQKSYSEVARRLSVSCSIFTFTLLGMAFGLSIGRKQSRSRLIFASLYAAFYLLCFLGAKAMDEQAVISMLLYIVPHVVIAGASYRRMVSIHRGMEAA